MDVLERAPVEVLAAEEDLLAVHDEELGVLDAARDRAEVDEPHLDSRHRSQRVGGLRVGAVHALIQDETHADAALRGRADRVHDLVHRLARPGRQVELLDVERSLRSADHLEPNCLRRGERRVPEPALHRPGLDELDRRGGEGRTRADEKCQGEAGTEEHAGHTNRCADPAPHGVPPRSQKAKFSCEPPALASTILVNRGKG